MSSESTSSAATDAAAATNLKSPEAAKNVLGKYLAPPTKPREFAFLDNPNKISTAVAENRLATERLARDFESLKRTTESRLTALERETYRKSVEMFGPAVLTFTAKEDVYVIASDLIMAKFKQKIECKDLVDYYRQSNEDQKLVLTVYPGLPHDKLLHRFEAGGWMGNKAINFRVALKLSRLDVNLHRRLLFLKRWEEDQGVPAHLRKVTTVHPGANGATKFRGAGTPYKRPKLMEEVTNLFCKEAEIAWQTRTIKPKSKKGRNSAGSDAAMKSASANMQNVNLKDTTTPIEA